MGKLKEYSHEQMLIWLESYFRNIQHYEVERYSKKFSPTRVPLYCIKEGQFRWGKIPGEDNEKLLEFLMKFPGFIRTRNNKISKTDGGKEIIVSYNQNKVIITIKNEKLLIKMDAGRVYTLNIERKKDELYIFDEIIIEITTAGIVSKEEFFPTEEIEIIEGEGPLSIPEASPVRFFQYYVPKARIFYAIPDYVEENEGFLEFKKVCLRRGIGLLKTSEKTIDEITDSRSLFDELCQTLFINKEKYEDIREIISDYLESNLLYLVYYPNPKYTHVGIIEYRPGKIDLIDKFQHIKNIQYSKELMDFAKKYRMEGGIQDICDVILHFIGELWEKRLGLTYPEIHRHLEEILLRGEKYRDHYVHQFLVFLMGAYIIEKMYDIKGFKRILNEFETSHKCKIEDAWLAASTYHDFNYGLQNFDDWLLDFFEDTLSIKNREAKENLHKLNLDAVMVRESLYEITKDMVGLFDIDADKDTKEKAIKFFYEKATRDRNHGVLSALSFLKICYNQEDKLKISHEGMFQAALAMACHDEDIWEALCGCIGYLKQNYPCDEGEGCKRKLYPKKDIEVHKLKSSIGKKRCETWEKVLMEKPIYTRIKFPECPLIFLLIFCDTVQEEGRITSKSFSSVVTQNKKEFYTQIDASYFSDWVDFGKKFKKFEEKNEKQAISIKNAFIENDYPISDTAQIFSTSKIPDKKWKIVDEHYVYEIGGKKGLKKTLIVSPREKECSLKKLSASFANVDCELIIDDVNDKVNELSRVSWALEDKRFKVHLTEMHTNIKKDVVIDGKGG